MRSSLKWSCICLSLLSFGWANAQVFPDNEARKAILDLRADVKLTKDDNKKSFEKIQSEKLVSDLELKKANDLIVKLTQSINDSFLEFRKLQQDIEKLNRLRKEDLAQQNQAVLQLKNENDLLKQQIAEMRGDREQLTRDITVLKREQKDLSAKFEESNGKLEDRFSKLDQRVTKIEPLSVQIDGLDIQTDVKEKKDFEAALATYKRSEATNAFVSFLRKYPNSSLRQSALFWVASARFNKDDFVDSVNYLKEFLNLDESHAKYSEAMLMLASAQFELSQNAEAKKTLENLVKDFPRSEAAKAAADRLNKFK